MAQSRRSPDRTPRRINLTGTPARPPPFEYTVDYTVRGWVDWPTCWLYERPRAWGPSPPGTRRPGLVKLPGHDYRPHPTIIGLYLPTTSIADVLGWRARLLLAWRRWTRPDRERAPRPRGPYR